MIRLSCKHCGQKLQVPETRAGQTGCCPKCKGRITVPAVPASEPPAPPVKNHPLAPADTASGPLNTALLDLPEPQAVDDQGPDARLCEQEALVRLGFTPPPEYTGERRFPWLIDILLYPVNTPGLTALTIIVGIPLSLNLVLRFVGLLANVLYLTGLIIRVIIGLYAGWYLAECTYDSAKGGTRAPEVFGGDIGLGGMWARVSYLIAVSIIYVLPAVLYPMYFSKRDAIYFVLVAWAVVFFPMGLLAMVMHDGTSVLNPFFLLNSILRVFLPYLGLLLVIAMFGLLLWLIGRAPTQGPTPLWLYITGFLATGYTSFVLAHLLGRFYWRYRDRLDWGL